MDTNIILLILRLIIEALRALKKGNAAQFGQTIDAASTLHPHTPNVLNEQQLKDTIVASTHNDATPFNPARITMNGDGIAHVADEETT